MEKNEFDCDKMLTDFLIDYLDGNLTRAERQSFEEYLGQNKKEKTFARKAMKGKKALNRLANKINTSSATA